MHIEKFLHQFWRCTEMVPTGEDKFVCDAGHYREKLVNRHTFLSGMHMEYDEDYPGGRGYIVFNVWDVSGGELVMDYYQTGYLKEIRPIKNGFVIVTGADEEGSTTYTFKKTKVNPFTKVKRSASSEGPNNVKKLLARFPQEGDIPT